jgi:putative SOS response-associated peptidase YedK
VVIFISFRAITCGRALKKVGRDKVKHFIKDTEGNMLFMVGLYQDTPKGREFIIITKDACSDVTDVLDRMPVLLRVNQIEDWLSGKLSPDDIFKMEFNVSVQPCEDESVNMSLGDYG